MNTILRCGLLTSIIGGSLFSASQAQVYPGGNGIAFTGVNQFDIYVDISSWHDMRGDRLRFGLDAQRQLEASLSELGVSRRPASRNQLVCRVQTRRNNAQVVYTSTLEFWALQSTDVHTLLWRTGDIQVVDSTEFSESLIAADCSRQFAGEWLKWNTASNNSW